MAGARKTAVMLGIQLSTLSTREVRRLLESAQARQQEGLARQLQAELDARIGRGSARPAPVADRFVEPVEIDAPPPTLFVPPRVRRRKPAVPMAAGVAVAVLAGGLTWGLSVPLDRPPATKAAPPRAAMALVQVAAPAEASPEPVEAEDVASPAPIKVASATPLPKARPDPCRTAVTAADRMVCRTPALDAQHRRMRAAYNRAVAAGADRISLDSDQARWRRSRDRTVDRQALASLYSRRIRELEALAAPKPVRATPAQAPKVSPAPGLDEPVFSAGRGG